MEKILSRPWLLLLFAPLFYMAPVLADPLQVHPAVDSVYSDLIIAHWPSAELVRHSLRLYGEIPLWNPHTLGGTPFAADPLSGLYYPPLWLALVLPPPLAFNILFLLHLVLAGTGAYRLARKEGAGKTGALLAGIAFGGLPKLAAHAAAGHLTLVLAVSWTPWLLITARRAARERSLRGWSLAGVMTGMIFLADPRWAVPSALAAAAYAFVSGRRMIPSESRRAMFLGWAKHSAVLGCFAAGISAVLALPMTEFVLLSTRAGLSGTDGAVLSLPFAALIGLVFSGLGGLLEWVIYPGAAVLLLVLFAALTSIPFTRPWPSSHGQVYPSPAASQKRVKDGGGTAGFWVAVFCLSLFLSLGSNIPGLASLMNAVPGLNLLRVPPRWMFLAGLALAMLAPRGLERLGEKKAGRGALRKTGFILAAGGFSLAAAAGAMGLPAALWQDGLVWGALGLIVFFGCSPAGWAPMGNAALIGLALADLAIADARMIDPRPLDPITDGVEQAVTVMADGERNCRIYSPSFSIPQLAAVRYGLRTLDGVDPLMLQSTADVVSVAAGVPVEVYAVTLPAFATGHPESDNRDAALQLERLGLLNVGYIASAFDLPYAMLSLGREAGGVILYTNLLAAPRVWMAESPEHWEYALNGRRTRIVAESPNRMTLSAVGPGLMVISEAAYPAWRATVDGDSAEILTVGGWWRAVEIGPGEHEVVMHYDPILLQIGLAVTALALLAFLGVWRWAA
jgi:hypothetical protein